MPVNPNCTCDDCQDFLQALPVAPPEEFDFDMVINSSEPGRENKPTQHINWPFQNLVEFMRHYGNGSKVESITIKRYRHPGR